LKAIILAAGMGTRLGKYTENMPKTMLEFMGKPLIQHQLETFRYCGVDEIVIVTGYRSEQFTFSNVTYYHNSNYENTNMVESLMLARQEMNEDIIVSYGDIIFEKKVLDRLIISEADFAVTVDLEWRKYWKARYDTVESDLESMRIRADGNIIEIGTPEPPVEDIDGRYVGLLKFSPKGLEILKSIYDTIKKTFWNKPWRTVKVFQCAYMTDMIQEIISRGYPVHAVKIRNGWLEFDTDEDYERASQWAQTNKLGQFLKI